MGIERNYWLQRAQEETEVDAAEEDIQQYHLKLLSHKHNLEQQLGTAYSAVSPPEKHRTLQQQQEQLANDLRKVICDFYLRKFACLNIIVRVLLSCSLPHRAFYKGHSN
jgi:hypothetical protein